MNFKRQSLLPTVGSKQKGRSSAPALTPKTHSHHTGRGSLGRALLEDDKGMSTVEYVILLAVIVVGAVGTWNEIGGKIKGELGLAADDINTLGE